MKPVVAVFVIAEVLDLATTAVGNNLLGTWEVSPVPLMLIGHAGWIGVLLFKAAVILSVALILQKATIKSKLVWLIPAVPVITVVWNLVNIFAEVWAMLT